MLGERLGQERLEQHALGVVLAALASLLSNHVALLVEAAEHGVAHHARVDAGVELQPVGRQRHHVLRRVVAGGCVQPDGARDAQQVVERGRLGQRVGALACRGQARLGGGDPLGVAATAYPLERQAGHLHSVERGLLGLPVEAADAARALERHVLDHVGDTAQAGGLVDAADVERQVERDHRRGRLLDQDELHAVVERLGRDAVGEVLRPRGAGEGDQQGQDGGGEGRRSSGRGCGWRRHAAGYRASAPPSGDPAHAQRGSALSSNGPSRR